MLHGHGCCKCGHEHRIQISCLTIEEIKQRLWELYHGDIIINETSYTKVWDYAEFKCNVCGNIWRTKVSDLLYVKRVGCPLCVKKSMEKPVIDALKNKKINFKHNVALEGSNYNGSSHPLRVDFIIETDKGKLAIETDGVQHFTSIYGEDELKYIQEHDRHKDKILKEKGYILIRVTSSPTKEWGFKNHITLKELLDLIEIGIDSKTGEINFELFRKYDFNRE